MRQVWKFLIPDDDRVTEMPVGAEPLSVGFQGEELYLWALVDIEAPTEGRHFIVRGTGHNIRMDNTCFIGTAFFKSLVFHVFELI